MNAQSIYETPSKPDFAGGMIFSSFSKTRTIFEQAGLTKKN